MMCNHQQLIDDTIQRCYKDDDRVREVAIRVIEKCHKHLNMYNSTQFCH